MTNRSARRVVFGLVGGLVLMLGSAVESMAAGPQFGAPGMPVPPAGGGGLGAPGHMQQRMSRQAAGRTGSASIQPPLSANRSNGRTPTSANMAGQFGGGRVIRNSQGAVSQAKTVNRSR